MTLEELLGLPGGYIRGVPRALQTGSWQPRTGQEMASDIGLPESVQGAAGVGLDLAVDPLSWALMGGGAMAGKIAMARRAARIAQEAKLAERAAEVADLAGDAGRAARIAEEAAPEIRLGEEMMGPMGRRGPADYDLSALHEPEAGPVAEGLPPGPPAQKFIRWVQDIGGREQGLFVAPPGSHELTRLSGGELERMMQLRLKMPKPSPGSLTPENISVFKSAEAEQRAQELLDLTKRTAVGDVRRIELNPADYSVVWEDADQAVIRPVAPTRPPVESVVNQIAQAHEALDRQKGSHNLVSLVDLRAALPDIPRAEFDAALQEMRRAGTHGLAAAESMGGISPVERAAGIQEQGQTLLHLSKKATSPVETGPMMPPTQDVSYTVRQGFSIKHYETPDEAIEAAAREGGTAYAEPVSGGKRTALGPPGPPPENAGMSAMEARQAKIRERLSALTPEARQSFEDAFSAYQEKAERIAELKRQGRYGYQLNMPKTSLKMAGNALEGIDSELGSLARLDRKTVANILSEGPSSRLGPPGPPADAMTKYRVDLQSAETAFRSMKKAEFEAAMRERGITVSGTKANMIAQVRRHYASLLEGQV